MFHSETHYNHGINTFTCIPMYNHDSFIGYVFQTKKIEKTKRLTII